jgi:hypothetical protein
VGEVLEGRCSFASGGDNEGGFDLPGRKGDVDKLAFLIDLELHELEGDRLATFDRSADSQHRATCGCGPVLT